MINCGSVDSTKLKLVTWSKNVDIMDDIKHSKEEQLKKDTVKPREQKEEQGVWDRNEMIQLTSRTPIDETFINKHLYFCYLFVKPDGMQVAEWCQGLVVAVLHKDKVIIK